MIHITKNAKKYIQKLLSQKNQDKNIRITITHPGTPYAECILEYFPKNAIQPNDIAIKFQKFSLYTHKSFISYLKHAKIHLKQDKYASQLILNAPKIFKEKINQHTTKLNNKEKTLLLKNINSFVKSNINPILLNHRGTIEIIDINKDMKILIKFHGSCNGCAMSTHTLKEGIEKKLLKNFPELHGVQDITEHQYHHTPFFDY
ncbi:MAG: iron-sulfur cluster carrier protein NfuA [Candidatus Westeberhardia cardiocondylae]|nr:iron-sulfur cluster carrier protein NfuA [Candidatus Westeberhardia cardiocondylae]